MAIMSRLAVSCLTGRTTPTCSGGLPISSTKSCTGQSPARLARLLLVSVQAKIFMNRLLIIATLVIAAVPLYAHGQEPNAAILKAEAQEVVSLISGDKLKTQTYCEIGDLSEQLDQAEEDKDSQRVGDLSQKI